MTYIELHENSRRGYYGGNVGYLTFSGQLDTGIIIRTAHLVRRTQDVHRSSEGVMTCKYALAPPCSTTPILPRNMPRPKPRHVPCSKP